MSVLGTGVAAGVAQTSLQAQELARAHDRKKAQEDESARRVRERFEAHLHSLEDPEKVEAIDPLHVDDHRPQEQSPEPEARSEQPAGDDQATQDADTPADRDQGGDGQLYHHLDVKA